MTYLTNNIKPAKNFLDIPMFNRVNIVGYIIIMRPTVSFLVVRRSEARLSLDLQRIWSRPRMSSNMAASLSGSMCTLVTSSESAVSTGGR